MGKTHLVREFGRRFGNLAEVNFEFLGDAAAVFEMDLDPGRIVRELSLLTGQSIVAGETLLFLDEIQSAPKAIASLRYFYERMPELHVVAAGSLLEFQVEKVGIPVGRVSTLYLYPLSFVEYLQASGNEGLVPAIHECVEEMQVAEAVHSRLVRLLGEYMALGGMPEAVATWLRGGEPREPVSVLRELIETFRQDFEKYARRSQVKYVERLFNEIPSFTGRAFKYHRVSGECRKRELEPGLDLLIKAGVAHKVLHSDAQGLPLGASARRDQFKALLLDVAVAQVVLGMEHTDWVLHPVESIANKGAMAEAFVGQELLAYSPPDMKSQLHYWHRQARSSNAEVDYVVAVGGRIVPIEVKSGAEGRLRSMRAFLEGHRECQAGVRFYGGLPHEVAGIRSLPLYCVAGLVNPDLLHR